MNVLRAYRLTPPQGKPFLAAIVGDDTGHTPLVMGKGHERPVNPSFRAMTNRDGKWVVDKTLQVEDLIMPEQRLGDWKLEKITVGDKGLASLRG